MKALVFSVLLILFSIQGSVCWDQEELDLFDLVEEIEENFYGILGVEQTASASEIKKAFRQLSLKLHPDKSDDPDATEKFRKLVAVAEVLKDEQKREWYDHILVEGLPDWKQPLYYYRRVRKMGLLEMTLLVLLIATVGHYLFGWAVYVEKQLVLQELLSRKQKKERKTKKSTKTVSSKLEAEVEYHTAQANASIPSLRRLLPVVLVKGCISLSMYCWERYSEWKEALAKRKEEAAASSQEENKEEQEDEAKAEEETDVKPVTKKRTGRRSQLNGHVRQNRTSQEAVLDNSTSANGCSRGSCTNDSIVGNEEYESGTYEDQLEAIMNDLDDDDDDSRSKKNHSVRKPSKETTVDQTSTSDIANKSNKTEERGRRERQVETGKAEKQISLDHVSSDATTDGETKISPPRTPLAEVSPGLNESWTQYQQKQLEWALTQYPKFSKDRWENVAKAVPGKNMDECVCRCKELFEAVRKRKVDNES